MYIVQEHGKTRQKYFVVVIGSLYGKTRKAICIIANVINWLGDGVATILLLYGFFCTRGENTEKIACRRRVD